MTSPSPYSQLWRWEVEKVLKGFDTSLTTPLVVSNAVQFPVTQVVSADPNTLDDYEEGSYTPTVTSTTGTFTTVSATGNYTKIGRLVHVALTITITTVGTAAGGVNVTLPFASMAGRIAIIPGRENAVNGKMLQGIVSASASSMSILNYDNTVPIGAGFSLVMSGSYAAVN